ncbi:hypothetical protein VTU32_00770 [Thermoanaerobacter sp. CM-CNRG TB177]|jgi:hypothetical protein|uniref:hypothetical protein n=1 Tax=Thermoanaerobacter sp. CM-CNRG TB177 TaxID=2800659 RepID=UPI001BDF27CF|nr:hypothetical protein [Thermoanaerobacter sp. CM-CNRG TB177]MBT1279301.1 hypothetical protein [Thermoanaerobacter sp. CM-CNRG TB177]
MDTRAEVLKAIRALKADFLANIIPQNDDTDEQENKKSSQADKLIQIALSEALLFHDELKDGYAVLPINGHREVWPLRSKFFKQYLVRRFFENEGKAPNNEAIRQALNVIEAKAMFDGPQINLNLRVAEHGGAFWYDLADKAWRAVKITPEGWEVVDVPPILFRRYKNTAPQVLPQHDGTLEMLKKYINLHDEEDWTLLIAAIVQMFIPDIPHAIPVFYGDKGAAKTTAQRVIRKLVDPAVRDTIALPNDKNELALLLTTNYAPCFDNLDGLSAWQSDMLCQAATGGGISKRELYTDMEEVILSFRRCPMLNGINLVASRDDLLDRSLLFRLERIDESKRKTEFEFWQEFEQDRPYILGAIFDTLSKAMAIYSNVKLPALPRMADFAMWGYAIWEAIEPGSGQKFMAAYWRNIAQAVEEAIVSDIVGNAIVEFMADKDEWQGTASELLEALNELPSVNEKDKTWPKRPNTLARKLNRIKSALADYGILVDSSRTEAQRTITLRKREKISSISSYRQEPSNEAAFRDDDNLTIPDDKQKISSCPEPLKTLHSEDNDDDDDIFADFIEIEDDGTFPF